MRQAALIVLILLPRLVLAQEPVPYATEMKPPVKVTKVVRVHYAKAEALAALVGSGLPVTVNADNNLQVIVLKGMPDTVASVEQAIRELDVPSPAPKSKDVEVIVSVIGASNGTDLPAGQEMPEGMAPVVKQLRAIFPYKNYQLLSTMLLRSKEGAKAENSGVMKSLSQANESNYFVGYDSTSFSPEAGKPVIHLRSFRFHTKLEVPEQPRAAVTMVRESNIDIATDIDLPEGQKTVVGKADTGSSDAALFVVLTARLVD